MQIRPYVSKISNVARYNHNHGESNKQLGEIIEYVVKRIARYTQRIFKAIWNILYRALTSMHNRPHISHNMRDIVKDINNFNNAPNTTEEDEQNENTTQKQKS